MPLVSLKEVYKDANNNFYAIGQFNVNNLEFIQAAVEAAHGMNSPVILAASTSAIKYAGLENLVSMVWTEAEKTSIPIILHLDHGATFDDARMCVDAGFTSVMIDGSHLPLEENIALTKKVVDYAHKCNVSVEAELGRLGGIEDEVNVDAKDANLTDPDEAVKFLKETDVDALAIAVGTSHGAYKFKGSAKLDFERIGKIKKLLGIPLVLHGASGVPANLIEAINKYGGNIKGAMGVPDDAYREAVQKGINKINIDTDLRLAFTASVREVLATQPDVFDPRKILGPAREHVKNIIKGKIEILGSAGKSISANKHKNIKPSIGRS